MFLPLLVRLVRMCFSPRIWLLICLVGVVHQIGIAIRRPAEVSQRPGTATPSNQSREVLVADTATTGPPDGRGAAPTVPKAGTYDSGVTPSAQKAETYDSGVTPSAQKAETYDRGAAPTVQKAGTYDRGAAPPVQKVETYDRGAAPTVQKAGTYDRGAAPPRQKEGKCGSKAQGAGCSPDGDFPCCGASGWCGITRMHCKCKGCVDYRRARTCTSQLRTATPGEADSVPNSRLLARLCPQCEPGDRYVAVSGNLGSNYRDASFDPCILPVSDAVSSVADLKEVYRIDAYSLGAAAKMNFVYASATFRSIGNYRTSFTDASLQEWPAPYIRPGSIAIDIGANVGDTTVPMSLFADRTIAIEAVPAIFNVLQAQSRLNPHLRIDAYNVALYEKDTQLSFSGAGGNAFLRRDGKGNLGMVRAVEPVKFLHRKYDRALLSNVSFIKIDTEGYDGTVLRLLKPWLDTLDTASKPLIQVEWWYNDRNCIKTTPGSKALFESIRAIGYKPFRMASGFQIDLSEEAGPECAGSSPDLMLYPKKK